jgi:hypothetical protein
MLIDRVWGFLDHEHLSAGPRKRIYAGILTKCLIIISGPAQSRQKRSDPSRRRHTQYSAPVLATNAEFKAAVGIKLRCSCARFGGSRCGSDTC